MGVQRKERKERGRGGAPGGVGVQVLVLWLVIVFAVCADAVCCVVS